MKNIEAVEIYNYLVDEGFYIKNMNMIHTSDNKYEIKESLCSKSGCNDYYAILAWIEDEKVKYKT